jgi:hypothetical protein
MADFRDEHELYADTRELVGVWADRALVTYSVDACTLDFLRSDSLDSERVILVARVTLSARETEALAHLIRAAVAEYTRIAIEEVLGADREDSEEAGG